MNCRAWKNSKNWWRNPSRVICCRLKGQVLRKLPRQKQLPTGREKYRNQKISGQSERLEHYNQFSRPRRRRILENTLGSWLSNPEPAQSISYSSKQTDYEEIKDPAFSGRQIPAQSTSVPLRNVSTQKLITDENNDD